MDDTTGGKDTQETVWLHFSVADCKDQGRMVELDFAWVGHSLSNPNLLIGSECVKVSGRT